MGSPAKRQSELGPLVRVVQDTAGAMIIVAGGIPTVARVIGGAA